MVMSMLCGLFRATSSTALVRSLVVSWTMAAEVSTTALPAAGRFSGIPGYQVISALVLQVGAAADGWGRGGKARRL